MDGTQTNSVQSSNFFQRIAQITTKIREKIKFFLSQDNNELIIFRSFSEIKKLIPTIDINAFANDIAQASTFILLNLKILQKNTPNSKSISLLNSITNPIFNIIYASNLRL